MTTASVSSAVPPKGGSMTLRKLFKLCGIVLVFSLFLVGGCTVVNYGWSSVNTYSEGYRDGFIRKVTWKGTAIKTYEIEVSFHGYGRSETGKTGQSDGGVWAANIIGHDDIVKSLAEIRGDELCRFHYEELRVAMVGGTKYRIDKIERLDDILPLGRERSVKAIEGRDK